MFTAAYSYTDEAGQIQDDVEDFATIEAAVDFLNGRSMFGAEIWQERHQVQLTIKNDQIVSWTV